MDSVTFLKHVTLDYELGCGFFLFRNFNQVFELLGLFLLCAFGLKVLYFDRFLKAVIRCLCALGVKSGELSNDFCSISGGKFRVLKFPIEELHVSSIGKIGEVKSKSEEKTNTNFEEFEFDHTGEDSDENLHLHSDEESDADCNVEDNESDVSTLRRLVKIERQRAKMAREELGKERAASATATEETMAMILRLQNEKSKIERELSQYRRLAEKKQIHDREVIQSLRWLVWRHESDRRLLEEQLKVRQQKSEPILEKDESEEEHSSNIGSDLENVLYSSLEANLSPG